MISDQILQQSTILAGFWLLKSYKFFPWFPIFTKILII